ASGFITGSNSFNVRATGGLIDQATVQAFEALTNQPGLVVDALSFELPESASRPVHVRLSKAPVAPVTVVTVNRGTVNDSPNLVVETGGVLTFNATNWNVPQTVSIHANADGDSKNDTAVFTVQASGGLSTNVAFTATQIDSTTPADAVYALRNDLG